MVHPEYHERQLLTGALEREYRNALRMMRSFPAERADDVPADCSRSGRDLAWGFVERERLLHYVVRGRMGMLGETAPADLSAILLFYEAAHRETSEALIVLTARQWEEVIRGPAGIGVWERGRRSELLWMAWKDLVHHGAHFAVHLRLARQKDAGEIVRRIDDEGRAVGLPRPAFWGATI
jgi:hypothetical protein